MRTPVRLFGILGAAMLCRAPAHAGPIIFMPYPQNDQSDFLTSKVETAMVPDADFPGVLCYVSRTIGVLGSTAEHAISCVRLGSLTVPARVEQYHRLPWPDQPAAFSGLRVIRYIDPKASMLIYLAVTEHGMLASSAVSYAPDSPASSANVGSGHPAALGASAGH